MKLLVIDGNSLINRAFYGIKLLTTKSGQFTNGIYGFINMLNKIMTEENPEGVAVAFDLRKPTFRHKMYAEYKAGRKGMPDELASQMPILKNWLTLMGYKVLEKEGYEADDILGTLSLALENSGNECIIATGDRDALQLVSERVTVLNTVTKMGRPEIIRYDTAAVREKYGVDPKGLIDIKALQGDSSDNIPGVAGVGEKTACSLIAQYGSLDYIYEHIDELEIKEGVRAKLIADKDSAYLSRELGTICREVPISLDLEEYKFGQRDTAAVVALMAELELFSIIEKMGLSVGDAAKKPDIRKAEYNVADGEIPEAEEYHIYFDYQAESAAVAAGNQVYKKGMLDEDLVSIIKSETPKNIYDVKLAYKYYLKQGVEIKSAHFDCMLAGYLLSPAASGYDLERLAGEYGADLPEINSEDSLLKSAALCRETARVMTEEIEKNGLKKLLAEIEMPLAEVLASMENHGFLIDKSGVAEMGERLATELKNLEGQIYLLSGGEFNINSPKQLGEVLFERLQLPAKKKTKSGYSTNAEVLESLYEYHPVIGLILEYRKLSKLKSTYCDGLIVCADEEGKIHSTLNQTETRTGRISSTEPNLQNIPVKTPEGRELRKFFRAHDGYLLIDADYSQIELRVLAHMAEDDRMCEAFRKGVDIHTVTASEVFGMPEAMVTPLMRSRAKAVNFGIVYGIGAFSLSKDIGVTRKEADAYIKGYLNTYSGVANFMTRTVEEARQQGFVTTMFDRRRYMPELTATNAMIRAAGERIARNMPIQGTAADIIKIAMIKVYNRLKAEIPEARLIMQIHDELIVEAPEEMAEKAVEILKTEMQNSASLSVPLIADTGKGRTWYDAKG